MSRRHACNRGHIHTSLRTHDSNPLLKNCKHDTTKAGGENFIISGCLEKNRPTGLAACLKNVELIPGSMCKLPPLVPWSPEQVSCRDPRGARNHAVSSPSADHPSYVPIHQPWPSAEWLNPELASKPVTIQTTLSIKSQGGMVFALRVERLKRHLWPPNRWLFTDSMRRAFYYSEPPG